MTKRGAIDVNLSTLSVDKLKGDELILELRRVRMALDNDPDDDDCDHLEAREIAICKRLLKERK